jgi:hypothetical protein
MLVAALAAAGCSSSSVKPSSPPPATLATLPPGVDPAAALSHMKDMLSAGDAAYRVAAKAHIQAGQLTYDYDITLAISGRDFQVEIDMSGKGTPVPAIGVIAVGGRGFVRYGSEWTETDPSYLGSMADQWAFLEDPANFSFQGMGRAADGTDVLVFTNTRPIPYAASDSETITYQESNMTDMVVQVRSDGVPVWIDAKITGKATKDGQPIDISGSASYTFTDFGSSIRIVAPI